MFKFLLKKRYRIISNYFTIFVFSLFFSFIFSVSNYEYNFFNIDSNKMLIILLSFLISGTIIFSGIFFIIHKLIELYRHSNPFKITYIKQNNKTLEVRYYPSLLIKKYYYNGLLHNEKEEAIQYANGELNDQFYLLGKEYTYHDFLLLKEKLITQSKVESF